MSKKRAAPAKKKTPAKKRQKRVKRPGEDHEKPAPFPDPLPETDFSTPELGDGELKIVSWNVASWNAIKKKGFKEYIEEEDPDIICLGETKIVDTTKDKDYLKDLGYEGYFYSCNYNAGYAGTAIFSKEKPIKVTKGMGVPDHDTEGRAITAEYESYYLIATYIPNSGAKSKEGDDKGWPKNLEKRLDWDKHFFAYLKELDKKKPIIWTGDLNVGRLELDICNPKTNRKTSGFTDKERESFDSFLKDGFVDTYREFNPEELNCYTFWTYKFSCRKKNIGWRLDYFVVSERLMPKVKESYIRPFIQGSDHCPICLHVEK